MPITPDTKSWTWVIERPCPECGFDATAFEPTDVAALVRANAAAWPAVLDRADVRVRPSDDAWSPLEYSAHVRDVFRIFAYRFTLMLDEVNPLFANWDQDATAIEQRYGDQDPAVVAGELADAAAAVVAILDGVDGPQWDRAGRRGDGASFTIGSFATYFLHDPVHHLWDVRF